jgi:predicted pyridoxine 5'-phosphate oxidase superfamily flavin-nucleotide-binding protein
MTGVGAMAPAEAAPLFGEPHYPGRVTDILVANPPAECSLIPEAIMGILTADMKRVIAEQRLGFIATVCPDGSPNLSPKGTTEVWDDDHLIFADIRSPGTIANLRQNPGIEINVVDYYARKGYRFKGIADIITEGPVFEKVLAQRKERGARSPIRAVVLMKVDRALPLTSPDYDLGTTEAEVRTKWRAYWRELDETAQPSS